MTSPVNQVNYGHGGLDSANFRRMGRLQHRRHQPTPGARTEVPAVWGSQPIRQMIGSQRRDRVLPRPRSPDGLRDRERGGLPGCSLRQLHRRIRQLHYRTPSPSATVPVRPAPGRPVWADSTQGPGRLRVTGRPDEAEVESSGTTRRPRSPTPTPWSRRRTAAAARFQHPARQAHRRLRDRQHHPDRGR